MSQMFPKDCLDPTFRLLVGAELKEALNALKARTPKIHNDRIAYWVRGKTLEFYSFKEKTAANYISQYVNDNGIACSNRFGARTIELFNQVARAPQAADAAEAPAPVQEALALPADQAAPEPPAEVAVEPEDAEPQNELADDLADLTI